MNAKCRLLLMLSPFLFCSTNLVADTYPTRSIKIVVPLAAGTGMDLVTRHYAESLSAALKTSVVVENQPGAAMMLAARNVSKATPDGYTLLVSAASAIVANPALYKDANYDPEKDFVPLSVYLDGPFVLVVNRASRLDTLKALVSRAQDYDAPPLTVATAGVGGLPHLAIELLKREHQLRADHVPYRNSGQIVSDVLGGHVNAAISEIGIVLPLITAGQLSALAITSSNRYPRLPAVPTVAETIGPKGFEVTAWHSLLAPAATPISIVEKLTAEMQTITGSAAFQKRVTDIGLLPRSSLGADDMRKFIALERTKWTAMIKSLKLDGSQSQQ